MCSQLGWRQTTRASRLIQPLSGSPEGVGVTIETFGIWTCTFNGMDGDIPVGQSRVSSETRSGCRSRRLHTLPPPPAPPPPTLSGGSVMALSFPRHVPGSFDTGNMHAGWQRPRMCGRDNDVHITPPSPSPLIEDCNLRRTFPLITHVSASKTRTRSCHWPLVLSGAFSSQERLESRL